MDSLDGCELTPQAVEAVGSLMWGPRSDPDVLLRFIRDAIHDSGPDSDAIRQALDLAHVKRWDEGARIWVCRPVGQWRRAQP